MSIFSNRTAFIVALLITIFPFTASSQDFLNHRNVQTLTTWDFLKGNEIPDRLAKHATRKWQSVTVPHTWNAKDVLEKGFEMYRGEGWYKTTLNITREKDKRYFLRFEGASIIADVYLNNRLLVNIKDPIPHLFSS